MTTPATHAPSYRLLSLALTQADSAHRFALRELEEHLLARVGTVRELVGTLEESLVPDIADNELTAHFRREAREVADIWRGFAAGTSPSLDNALAQVARTYREHREASAALLAYVRERGAV